MINYDQNDIYVTCNENLLIQALLNILNNARDALKNLDSDDKFVFIELLKNQDEIQIGIKDKANGIDEEIIDKIFEPYFTTKHKSLGTGIGLYMTNQIITKHLNSDIFFENTKYEYDGKNYKGALFKISMQE